ncbi:hypothetical protein [Pseudonocardia charpentierae]|uniref:Transcription factor WhiB n=1 Tax=Pseudonocardia charpentierae TaxID=3075545 RepID=A0ABU2NJ56_9PSEU|nr:hypothetical protein [Pseudonocardia sp. DSM 45834]MDT0353740.1 hypothetical protein [Pseudonocardia sp. DSM 45834]
MTAEAYCGPCTDRERCAEFARTNNLVGLWGGVLRHRPTTKQPVVEFDLLDDDLADVG